MKHPQLYITWWCVEDLGWANIDSVDLVDENQHNTGNILIYFFQYWSKEVKGEVVQDNQTREMSYPWFIVSHKRHDKTFVEPQY